MSTNLFLIAVLALVMGVVLASAGDNPAILVIGLVVAIPTALTGAVVRAIERNRK